MEIDRSRHVREPSENIHSNVLINSYLFFHENHEFNTKKYVRTMKYTLSLLHICVYMTSHPLTLLSLRFIMPLKAGAL